MNLAKLIQSNSVSGSRSSSGMIMTTKAVVGIVVVVALLVAASFIVFTPSIGAAGDPTTTKTVTQTQVLTSVVGLGNATTQGLNPEAIHSYANESVVTLQGVQTTTTNTVFGPQTSEETILGSGFVIDYSNQYYVVTNYHVAGATSNLTLTFSGGNSYPAKVVGSDPYSDLAVVTVSSAPLSEFHPLTLVSSSTLQVGQYILAIGNPYGLSGTETFGIISQLGETIQDETAGNFSIADVIQFSAPINPGNSGGALLNANGSVVGITTATVSGSQGIGFAIPSDTILRELPSLIAEWILCQAFVLGHRRGRYELPARAGNRCQRDLRSFD